MEMMPQAEKGCELMREVKVAVRSGDYYERLEQLLSRNFENSASGSSFQESINVNSEGRKCNFQFPEHRICNSQHGQCV